MADVLYVLLCVLEIGLLVALGNLTLVSIIFGFVGSAALYGACTSLMGMEIVLRMMEGRGFQW